MQNITKGSEAPAWCIAEFPDQVKNLQTEVLTCKKQLESAAKRIEYIQKIFAYCSQATEWLEFSNDDVVTGVGKILDLAGWQSKADSTEPRLLRLTDDSNRTVLALVAAGKVLDRSHLGVLIKSQTDWWQESGEEPVAFLVYDSETSSLSPELMTVATKKSIGLLSKSTLLKMTAEILLKEKDPDDLRADMLQRATDTSVE